MRIRRSYAIPAAALLLATLAGPALAEVINGTNGPDVLYGTAGADTIRGYNGADTVYARAGDDTVYGGLGADRIYGRKGADRLYPGNDSYPGDGLKKTRDVLRGGPGPDRIIARTPDVVYAGDGNDTVRVVETYDWETPTIDCGPGRDTAIATYAGSGMSNLSNCERMVRP